MHERRCVRWRGGKGGSEAYVCPTSTDNTPNPKFVFAHSLRSLAQRRIRSLIHSLSFPSALTALHASFEVGC